MAKYSPSLVGQAILLFFIGHVKDQLIVQAHVNFEKFKILQIKHFMNNLLNMCFFIMNKTY